MKKVLIKIIKRTDVEAAAFAGTQKPPPIPAPPPTPQSAEQAARHSRRDFTETISEWILERRRHRRAEDAADNRRFRGGDLRLEEI